MEATHQQKHEAGRHLAVAEALLHGYRAEVVDKRTFIRVNGHIAQVQVAARGSWQISNVDKYLEADVERVVLVDITRAVPEFYVVPGDRLRSLVRKRYDKFMERVDQRRPRNPESKHSRIDPTTVKRWKDRWSVFD
jgi:hypothetical protein